MEIRSIRIDLDKDTFIHENPSFHMYSGVPAPCIYRIGAHCRKRKKKRSTK